MCSFPFSIYFQAYVLCRCKENTRRSNMSNKDVSSNSTGASGPAQQEVPPLPLPPRFAPFALRQEPAWEGSMRPFHTMSLRFLIFWTSRYWKSASPWCGKGWNRDEKGLQKPPKLVWIIPSLCKQPKAPRPKGPNKGTCWNYWCFNLGIDPYFDPDFQVLASPASPQDVVDAHMRDAWLGSSHGTCERLHGLHLTSGKKDTNRIKQYKIQMCHFRFAVYCQPSFRLSAVYFQSKPRTSRDWSNASLPFTMTRGYVQCRPCLPSCKIYGAFLSIFSWQSLGYVNSPGPQLFLAAVQKRLVSDRCLELKKKGTRGLRWKAPWQVCKELKIGC